MVDETGQPGKDAEVGKLDDATKFHITEFVRTLIERRHERNLKVFATFGAFLLAGLASTGSLLQSWMNAQLNNSAQQASAAAQNAALNALTTDLVRAEVRRVQSEAIVASGQALIQAAQMRHDTEALRARNGEVAELLAQLQVAGTAVTSPQAPPVAAPPSPVVAATPLPDLPPGSVLAYIPRPGGGCPQGWARLAAADGRFIRAAGGPLLPTTTEAPALGGEEARGTTARFGLPQDPRRVSDINWGSTPWAAGPNPARGGAEVQVEIAPTPPPPFISLLFCWKEHAR